ncbi:MAG: hypothetical protein HXK22_01350, partial [Alloprevotella tannerae]|nr:hypothetical protein [Alloprevotella tannerae]
VQIKSATEQCFRQWKWGGRFPNADGRGDAAAIIKKAGVRLSRRLLVA